MDPELYLVHNFISYVTGQTEVADLKLLDQS